MHRYIGFAISGLIGAMRLRLIAPYARSQKKTQQTAQRDIELAAKRLREWKAQQ